MSQHSQQSESKSEDPVDECSQRIDAEDPGPWVLEEVVGPSSGQHVVIQKVPVVVLSRAWVDEVKTLKQGGIHVGRGSKQRGLLRATQGRSPGGSTVWIEGA